MGEGLVGFSHTVGIFLLLHGTAFALGSCDDLVGQLVGNGLAVALAGETDQPLHGEGDLTVGTNFGRDLEGGATDTAAAYFYARRYIGEGAFPYFVTIFGSHGAYLVDSIVESGEYHALVTADHQAVYETGNLLIVKTRVWCEGELFSLCFSHLNSENRANRNFLILDYYGMSNE